MSYLKGMIEEMQETEGKKHRKKKVIVCILAPDCVSSLLKALRCIDRVLPASDPQVLLIST